MRPKKRPKRPRNDAATDATPITVHTLKTDVDALTARVEDLERRLGPAAGATAPPERPSSV